MKPPVLEGLRPEPPRDGYGRYLLPDPRTGELRAWTRATTLAHTLDDTTFLTKWKRRMVLQGCAADPSILDVVPSLVVALNHASGAEAKDLKKALDDVCDTAAALAGAGDGAGWGTALHTLTEYHDAGHLHRIEVPIDLAPDLACYQRTLTDAGIRTPIDHIERIVVNTTVDTAGTYDRLLRLPDGRLVVGDLKSQQNIFDWLSIAIQLAQYAHADAVINPDTGQLEMLPPDLDVTVGVVIHLPARSATCTLYEVDLDAGWRAAQLAHQVRQARADGRRLGTRWQPGEVDKLLAAIRVADTTDQLTTLWRIGKPAGTWTDTHTQAAAARKAQLAQVQVAA